MALDKGDVQVSEPYNDAEIEYVRLNYLTSTHQEIGDHIGRSRNSVRNYCYDMKWRKKVEPWTLQEVEYLTAEYAKGNVNLYEIAGVLKRTRANVCRKAREFGLTDICRHKTEDHAKKMAIKAKKWYATHEHPRGNLGNRMPEQTKRGLEIGRKRAWNDPNHYYNSEERKQETSDRMTQLQKEGKMRQGYSRGSMGKREDLGGLYVRSSWEANYARYLNWLIEQNEILKWEYEPDVFSFDSIKRGCRTYLPDFKVFNPDGTIEYHEVKGWMDQKSKTKLSRMQKYHPNIKLIIIGKDEYYALQKSIKSFIPNWE